MLSDRVLIWLKYRFIGDAVLATPLMEAIGQKYPVPDVLAAPHLCELLAAQPTINLVKTPRIKGVAALLRQARELRQHRYDIAVVINRNFRSALAARLAGIPRRIGFATDGRRALLTDAVPYDRDGLEGDCYAKLGEPLGLRVVPFPPRLHLRPDERERGPSLAQGASIGFIPGSTNAHRVIPPEKGAQIQAKLGEPIALLGAASERDFADRLLDHLPDGASVDLVGKLSLRESMAAIASLSVVIGPDSGLIHVSAGLGTPTVTTFSFSQAEKWGHYYEPHTVLRTGENSMLNMSVDDVVNAARRHL